MVKEGTMRKKGMRGPLSEKGSCVQIGKKESAPYSKRKREGENRWWWKGNECTRLQGDNVKK